LAIYVKDSELEKYEIPKTTVYDISTNEELLFTVPAKEAVVLAYLLSIEFDSAEVKDFMQEAIVLEGERTYSCCTFVAYKEEYLEERKRQLEQQAALEALLAASKARF